MHVTVNDIPFCYCQEYVYVKYKSRASKTRELPDKYMAFSPVKSWLFIACDTAFQYAMIMKVITTLRIHGKILSFARQNYDVNVLLVSYNKSNVTFLLRCFNVIIEYDKLPAKK